MECPIIPLNDKVVILPIEEGETTYGNIVVPDLGNEVNKTAKVISVGPGAPSVMGSLMPTTLKAGDIVVLPTMGFTKFEYKGEEFWIGRENDILAKISPERTSIEEVIAQTEVTEQEKEYLTNE